jgi:excisionase family DNA binding protein
LECEVPEQVELHDVREVAKRFKVSPWTIRGWIAKRKIAVVHVGRLVRVPASEIDRLILRGTVPARDTE